MPVTSVMLVTLRVPPAKRVCCTMMSTAEAICSRIAAQRQVHARPSAPSSRGAPARRAACWRAAWSASRRGRCSSPAACRALRRRGTRRRRCGRAACAARSCTRSRIAIAPLPSTLAGRVSRLTTCSWCSCSSAASSMVTMRSPVGMKFDRTLSSVVLPEPVPPEMTMFLRATTQTSRNSAIAGLSAPKLDQVARRRACACANLRIVSAGPVQRQRRDDGVDARAVLQARVDHRRRLVDAAAERRDDALDHAQHRAFAGERQRVPLQPAGALDVDLVEAVDHDLGDAVVGQQLLERPEAERLVEHLLAQQSAVEFARNLRLQVVQDLLQQQHGGLAQPFVGHAVHVLPAQVHRLEQPGVDARAPFELEVQALRVARRRDRRRPGGVRHAAGDIRRVGVGRGASSGRPVGAHRRRLAQLALARARPARRPTRRSSHHGAAAPRRVRGRAAGTHRCRSRRCPSAGRIGGRCAGR